MDNAENQRAAQGEKAESHGDSDPNSKPLDPKNIENLPSEAGVLGDGYRERDPQARKHHQHISRDGHSREVSNFPERHPKNMGATILNALAVVIAIFALGVSIKACTISQDQVDVATKTFLGQQRPWVKISEARIAENAMTTDIASGAALLSVRFKITNTGVVPATNISSIAYDYYPMSSLVDFLPRDGEPSFAAKICAKHRDAEVNSNQSFGGTLFPNDSRDADSNFSSGFPDKAEVDLGTAEGAFFPGGMIVVHVTYQSSMDPSIRCTAEAYFLRIKTKKLIVAPKLQVEGKWMGEIDRRNFMLETGGIGGSYAD